MLAVRALGQVVRRFRCGDLIIEERSRAAVKRARRTALS